MSKERSITVSVDIPAPPERVWDLASDVTRYADWVENTLEVYFDGTVQMGTTYEERTRIAGPWKVLTRWRVTEFERPRRQVHEGEGVVAATGMAVVIDLTPDGQSTHMALTIRYTPRFGPVGAVIDRAIAGQMTRAQERSVKAFAVLVARESTTT
jgi:uncharacterized protein YndB with AHSA1/START domain